MYRSELSLLIAEAVENSKWTRSTKNEDNFRQVLCANLYHKISPNNIEIPSTRSGHGDIRVFGRRIELKYANDEKGDSLDLILEDFDLLLGGKIEFCLVVLRLDVETKFDYLHSVVKVPTLAKGKAVTDFAQRRFGDQAYCGPAIFLGAVYPHQVGAITPRSGKGKNSTAYLSFETSTGIERSYFLEVAGTVIHCDVIGTREDGLLAFLFKRAEGIHLACIKNSREVVEIPHEPSNIKIAEARRVNVRGLSPKPSSRRIIEAGVMVFRI